MTYTPFHRRAEWLAIPDALETLLLRIDDCESVMADAERTCVTPYGFPERAPQTLRDRVAALTVEAASILAAYHDTNDDERQQWGDDKE